MQDAGVLKPGKSAADFKEIKDFLRPNMVQLFECKDVLLEGVTFQNSPGWCLHPLLCERMVIRDIYAKNPWYAQNGDGLDLESCKDVLIERSTFDVGDDGICMKSGRDEEGRKRGAPTQNVLIQYCTVYHAHGGFVVGSEMSGGVKNVAIRNSSFIGTDIGLRFKTTRGRGGIVENIYVTGINMNDIKGDAIRFDMYYAAKDPVPMNGEVREAPKRELLPVTEATPQFRKFYIDNINCLGAAHSLFFRGLPEMAIKDINLSNLSMQSKNGIELIEADGIQVHNMRSILTGDGPEFVLNNARNIDFQGLVLSQLHKKGKATIQVAGTESKNINIQKSSFNAASATAADYQFLEGAVKSAVSVKP